MSDEGCGADAADAHLPGADLLGVRTLGALGPGERAAADAHLAACPSCREEARELALVPRALADLPLDAYLTDFLLTPDRMGDLARRVLERAADECSAADETPAAGGAPVADEYSVADEIPATDEAPTADECSVADETPAASGAPVADEY